MTRPAPSSDPATWWRTLCTITPGLVLSGDLPANTTDATVHLRRWSDAGVTDVLDVRGEWNDECFVAVHAPHLTYHHLGTHDNGTTQQGSWFDRGTDVARRVHDSDATLLVHCHMGVNRAPSMALAILLDRGWDPIEALTAIRDARPIAAIAYAADAVTWFHQRHHTPAEQLVADLRRVDAWHSANHIDLATVIRRIRVAEIDVA